MLTNCNLIFHIKTCYFYAGRLKSSFWWSQPTAKLKENLSTKQQKEVSEFSFLRRCFKNSSVFYEHIFVFLLIINEWMNARKSAARGPHFQYKKTICIDIRISLSIKERYGTALRIFGMFYVIYLSKFTEFSEMRNCE